jgi:signal transduction histidine kinase
MLWQDLDRDNAVKTCVAMVKMDCELRDVHIEVKATARLPVVVADEIHLQQVILNLLRNSIEAVEHQQSLVSREIEVDMGLCEPNTAFVSWRTVVEASPRATWSVSSSRSIRPSQTGWALGSRSAAS